MNDSSLTISKNSVPERTSGRVEILSGSKGPGTEQQNWQHLLAVAWWYVKNTLFPNYFHQLFCFLVAI